MTSGAQRRSPGVAYPLWQRIQVELNRLGMTQTAFLKAAGLYAPTLSNLRVQTQPPAARIVHQLASGLGTDESGEPILSIDEAMRLAGRVTAPSNDVDARVALLADPRLTPQARAALIAVYDAFVEQAAADMSATSQREAM